MRASSSGASGLASMTFMGSGAPLPRRELAGHVLDPVDEAREKPLGFGHRSDVGYAGEQLGEHGSDLLSGQVGSQAVVRPEAAEPEMVVGPPADVEALGLVEDGLVAVGRVV